MLFTSISFLYYFLPILLIVYFITPKKYKNVVLLIASLLFYFYGEPKYIFLMLIEIFIAYIGALLIDKYKENSKIILIVTLFIHILLLIIFKYTDFIVEVINDITKANIKPLNIALPIGISFYTFQIISYIVDVYRGEVKAQKNIIKLATYVSLFPQLVAGPIVRYQTIEEELDNRTHDFSNFSYGIRRFTIGLTKKVLIANALGELCTKFSVTSERSVVFYWIFAISYMLQIYFDFSAYSDMAIGLGRMFGFHFPENFNYPYISKSITEFWRRWHISLSTWFKDYIYIPLGGSRVNSKTRLVFNVFVVWFLTGVWHGANWTFIVWGLMYFVLLILEKFFHMDEKMGMFKNLYTMFFVMMGWVLFRSDSLSAALVYIRSMFGFGCKGFIDAYVIQYFKQYILYFIMGILCCFPIFKNIIVYLKRIWFITFCMSCVCVESCI